MWNILVPYSLKPVIKNKKMGSTFKANNLDIPPGHLSRLISRLPGLEPSKGHEKKSSLVGMSSSHIPCYGNFIISGISLTGDNLQKRSLVSVRDKFESGIVFKCFQDEGCFNVLDSWNPRELVVDEICITVHVFDCHF